MLSTHQKKEEAKPNKSISQHQQAVQFKDNRSEASNQLKIQEIANQSIQRKANNTGLPNNLKSGIENLSGYSMDDVKVHYNSPQPAQLQAHAFAQGTNIHIASGQEKHLPHEAWHVVQQKQGRVQPTRQLKSIDINDDDALEREANVMGAKAAHYKGKKTAPSLQSVAIQKKAIQCFFPRAILNNYRGARNAWNLAYNQVDRFDREIDTQRRARWRGNNATLNLLARNVGLKSTRAQGTMSGEAYETKNWHVNVLGRGRGASIIGPGGAAGIDIRTYQPGLGTNDPSVSRNRSQIEVKTAQTPRTLKDGLNNGGRTRNGDTINVYYHGPDEDVTGLRNFNRAPRNYHVNGLSAMHEDDYSASVTVFRSDGTTVIRRFDLTWS